MIGHASLLDIWCIQTSCYGSADQLEASKGDDDSPGPAFGSFATYHFSVAQLIFDPAMTSRL